MQVMKQTALQVLYKLQETNHFYHATHHLTNPAHQFVELGTEKINKKLLTKVKKCHYTKNQIKTNDINNGFET